MKDYYAILGVSFDAEYEVINAAYRAMAKKYHPDIYKGDKKFAEDKIKDINEAFENLSDETKRKAYDKNFKKQSGSGSFDDYNQTSDDDDIWHDDYLKDAWKTIVEYYPEAETERKKLAKIQKRLALEFQFVLIETKTSTNYEIIAEIIEKKFFEKYFGDDETLHKIVKNLLLNNQTKIALEINKAIKILGSVSSKDIIQKMKSKYGNKINHTGEDIYRDQSKVLERTVKNFQFKGKGKEDNYVYDYKYNSRTQTILIKVEVYLDDDIYKERPFPVVNFEINLVEKYLTKIDVIFSDDYFHYDDFYELIDHVEKELEKSA